MMFVNGCVLQGCALLEHTASGKQNRTGHHKYLQNPVSLELLRKVGNASLGAGSTGAFVPCCVFLRASHWGKGGRPCTSVQHRHAQQRRAAVGTLDEEFQIRSHPE